jgi:hypothetical protein
MSNQNRPGKGVKGPAGPMLIVLVEGKIPTIDLLADPERLGRLDLVIL